MKIKGNKPDKTDKIDRELVADAALRDRLNALAARGAHIDAYKLPGAQSRVNLWLHDERVELTADNLDYIDRKLASLELRLIVNEAVTDWERDGGRVHPARFLSDSLN